MLQDASLAVERAQSKKKQAEKRAEDAENQVGLLTVERDTLQQRYETSVSTASTAYRILAALQEQINLERSLSVRCSSLCAPAPEGVAVQGLPTLCQSHAACPTLPV